MICGTIGERPYESEADDRRGVRTEEFADWYEITVSDDGPGFDPSQTIQDGYSHIGLKNVKERLQRVVSGSLRIDSAPGTGTRAVIVIPKGEV